MSKNIKLVLISSSLILGGCASDRRDEEEYQGTSSWWYFHQGGGMNSQSNVGSNNFSSPNRPISFNPTLSSTAGRGGGFRSSPAVSARGGFGASAHAFGGSGG